MVSNYIKQLFAPCLKKLGLENFLLLQTRDFEIF